MMGENTCRERPVAVPGETNLFSVDLSGKLDEGELAASIGGVVDADETGDLTITDESVSSEELTILGEAVAAGKACQFKVVGQQEGTTYRLKITFTTDSSPAQTKVLYVLFLTEDE